MRLLIFIPARKGNKKSENKNLFKVNGVPLIEYALNIAKKMKVKGKIFISSNHKAIINKYKKFTYGYSRPKYLAKTGSNIVDSILDASDWFKERGHIFDTVLLLPPTSPLRTKKNIEKALSLIKLKKFESLLSAVYMREHPYLCVRLKSKNKWDYLKKKNHQLDFDKLVKKFIFLDGNFKKI